MTFVPPRQRADALLMLILANVFWGLSFPLIKTIALTHQRLLPASSTWFVTAWTVGPRFLLAAGVLLVWQRRSLSTITRKEWQQGLALGLFSGAGMLFQTDGLQFTAASTSAFLTQFYAIMIPVFLALQRRAIPPLTVWLSCGLVMVGVGVLGHFNFHTLRLGRGEIETLVSSVFFMGQILTLDHRGFSVNRVLPVCLLMFAVQGLIFAGLALATAPTTSSLLATWRSPTWATYTLVLTLFSTLGAYLIMNRYQPRITATEAGLIYCIEPIFGSLMALFLPAILAHWAGVYYPNETATTSLLVGGGLITVANILVQLKPLPK